MHEGPLHTVLGDNVRVGKQGPTAAAQFDPFEGMPTYSMKYKKKRRRLPKLDTRPYGNTKELDLPSRDDELIFGPLQSLSSSLKSSGPFWIRIMRRKMALADL